MKKILITTLFTLATLAWASAQQPGSMPQRGSGAPTSPGSQAPGAQSQPSSPGDQAVNAPITEGCLGGSSPNFTLTDKTGTTYKLNIPPNANTSVLSQHMGEPIQVAGNVNDSGRAGTASIDVQGIGKGTGKCLGTGSSGTQPPPKQ